MSRIHSYVIQYSDGKQDVLQTESLPFTPAKLKAASGRQRYEFWDHIGNKIELIVDADKVVDVYEVEEPPGPPHPTM